MRIGVFGWASCAKSPTSTFRRNLASSDSWLAPSTVWADIFSSALLNFSSPTTGLGSKRGSSSRFSAVGKRDGSAALYAIGAFLQALEQNPGVERSSRILARELMCTWERDWQPCLTYEASISFIIRNAAGLLWLNGAKFATA